MKKIICLLLCLMLVLPAAGSLGFYGGLIDQITFSVVIPKIGERAGYYPHIDVPGGELYYCAIDESAWLTPSFTSLNPSTVFEAGKTYYAGLYFEPIYPSDDQFYSGTTVNCTNAKIVMKDVGTDYARIIVCFTIPIPEKVTLSKLKSVKLTALSAKKLKVTWKKLSSKDQKKIQKIQIQYSTDKTFKTGVKTKWAKKGKTSYTISGLKKSTKYYVRIRAYKKDGNITYVSKWVTKSKKTKKK